jgi:hypothetical protein
MNRTLPALYKPLAALALIFALLYLEACKKEEEIIDELPPPGDTIPDPPPPLDLSACFPIQALSPQVESLYEWEYYPDNPQLLKYYKEYDSETGVIDRTYEFKYTYNTLNNQYLLDTMITYIGNFLGPANFLEKTVYEYEFTDSVHFTITGATLYRFNEAEEGLMLIKGNFYFDYDLNGLPTEITYTDFVDNDMGTQFDNHRYAFEYDSLERIRVSHFFDYNDQETTTEYFTPSPYYKAPTFELTMHPLMRWGYRFAHQTQIIQFGSLQYTYNFVYQANDRNYVIERSSINSFNGDTLLLSLITYNCYD